jgi:hypothetical protein
MMHGEQNVKFIPRHFFPPVILSAVYICYRKTLLSNEAVLHVCDVCIDRDGQQFEHFQLLIVTLC